jgi:AbrB family looped-hinge helix DNA binding protein
MEEVTVSPKYQIVIPKEIRESMKIRPGQKLIMMTEDGTIELRPLRSLKELQALFKGIQAPEFKRDPDREFD